MLPPGIVSLIALHDVGKISPGFQLKCKSWEALLASGLLARDWRFAETFHAAVSHAIIGNWLGLDRAGYAVVAGGHHGKLPVYTDIPEMELTAATNAASWKILCSLALVTSCAR